MDSNKKQLLKKQLEQQAERLVTEKDGVDLTASLLQTCAALLRTAEKTMPDKAAAEEIQSLYAGYLGIAARVKQFYQSQDMSMESEKRTVLEEMVSSLREAEEKQRSLKEQIEVRRQEYRVQEASFRESQEEAKRLLKQLREKEEAHRELESLSLQREKELAQLEESLRKMKEETASYEGSIEQMTKEITAAKDYYEELTAYYQEIDIIRRGIEEEGFVDVRSFNGRLREMNSQGENLIREYDEILKKMLKDVEALQDKIRRRQRPGMV